MLCVGDSNEPGFHGIDGHTLVGTQVLSKNHVLCDCRSGRGEEGGEEEEREGGRKRKREGGMKGRRREGGRNEGKKRRGEKWRERERGRRKRKRRVGEEGFCTSCLVM